jgi:transposase
MPRVIVISLSTDMRSALRVMVARGQNWRERQRAQTLLYFDDGMSAAEAARLLDVHIGTVLRTRRNWFETGLDSLSDLPRSGAPRKISEQQTQRLVALASEQPMSAKQLLAMHVESGGAAVHLNTLTAALHKAGLVWKRTRHSLKKTK